jgi:hypothetical protein
MHEVSGLLLSAAIRPLLFFALLLRESVQHGYPRLGKGYLLTANDSEIAGTGAFGMIAMIAYLLQILRGCAVDGSENQH